MSATVTPEPVLDMKKICKLNEKGADAGPKGVRSVVESFEGWEG